jgi:hypothetical protein
MTMYQFSLRNYMQYIRARSVSSLVKQDSKNIEQQLIAYLVDLRRNQKLSYASYPPKKDATISAATPTTASLVKVERLIEMVLLLLVLVLLLLILKLTDLL